MWWIILVKKFTYHFQLSEVIFPLVWIKSVHNLRSEQRNVIVKYKYAWIVLEATEAITDNESSDPLEIAVDGYNYLECILSSCVSISVDLINNESV